MVTVAIPLLFKKYTHGVRRAEISAADVAELIERLDELHPGIQTMIRDGERLKRTVTILVDGQLAVDGLATPIGPESEVTLLPAFGGG